MSFEGIPIQMAEFFMQIRFNNNAEFFEEHRKDYERYVKQPLYALADALAPAVLAIDPGLETRPAKVVSRIRRDTRFSRNKSPYRDHMWIGWRPVRMADGERRTQIPGLYVTVEAAVWAMGVGYYQATPAAMRAFRERVAASPSMFLSIAENIAPFELKGEDYARPQKGSETIPPQLLPWYNKKSFYVEYAQPLSAATGQPQFIEPIEKGLARLAPLYHFLNELPTDNL